jgi:hypothetical protein
MVQNLDSTSRVHLNSNAGKLSRFMVATDKYGESMTWRLIARKTRPWFDSQKAVVKLMP